MSTDREVTMARTEASLLTQDEFRTVAEQESAPAISSHCHAVRANDEPEENSWHRKNLLGEVEERLKTWEHRPKQIDALLEPLQGVLDDGHFWNHQLDRVACFRTPDL